MLWLRRSKILKELIACLFQTGNEVSGLMGQLRASFHGKVGYKQSFLRREFSSSRGGRIVVASVVCIVSPLWSLKIVAHLFNVYFVL